MTNSPRFGINTEFYCYQHMDEDDVDTLLALEPQEYASFLEGRPVDLEPYPEVVRQGTVLVYCEYFDVYDDPEKDMERFISQGRLGRSENGVIRIASTASLQSIVMNSLAGVRVSLPDVQAWDEKCRQDISRIVRVRYRLEGKPFHVVQKILLDEAENGSMKWGERLTRKLKGLVDSEGVDFFLRETEQLCDIPRPHLNKSGGRKGMLYLCSCGIPDCGATYAWFEDAVCLMLGYFQGGFLDKLVIFPSRLPLWEDWCREMPPIGGSPRKA